MSRAIAVLGVVGILGGCAADDSADSQRAELSAVLAALSLRPMGSEAVEPRTVRSKGGPPYVVATGIADLPRDAALGSVRAALQQLGWETREDRAVEHFLGWELRAVKAERRHARLDRGLEAAGVPGSPYRRTRGPILRRSRWHDAIRRRCGLIWNEASGTARAAQPPRVAAREGQTPLESNRTTLPRRPTT